MFLLSGVITMVSYGAELAKIAQFGTTVQNESSEQSSSSFPSNFSIFSSPTPEQFSSSESSPQLSAAPISEPISSTVGVQQSDFKQLIKLGYTYYGQREYQTALIIFNRALQARPGNVYAVKAIDNTKMAIAQAKAK